MGPGVLTAPLHAWWCWKLSEAVRSVATAGLLFSVLIPAGGA